MKNLIYLSIIILFSCSKSIEEPQVGISMNIEGKHLFYSIKSINVITEPWCGNYLTSIYFRTEKEFFLISITSPENKLTSQEYNGGMNYWGDWSFVSDVTLNVISVSNGVLRGEVKGQNCSGTITILYNNEFK